MQSQTRIFSQLVRDTMRPAQVVLSADTSVAEMLTRMSGVRTTCALITDGDGRLLGLVTEQDVTRRVALKCSGQEPVSSIMTSPVQSVQAEDFLYRAIARMRRFRWRHMPVIDRDERPVGEIMLNDALGIAAEQAIHQIDLVAHEGGIEGLREVKAAQVQIATELQSDNVPAPEIQALITDINRGIHRRIIDAQLDAMKAEGWGDPPVDFSLLIMGSGGRGENFLTPDQDNGFILDDYPDERHTEIDGFFIELAERLTFDLNAVGFTYCRGYVMATNPMWRKNRSQWREQLRIWGCGHSSIAVQLGDIFFDFACGYGRTSFVRELREHAYAMVRDTPDYIRGVEAELFDHGVALGWFGRFVTESGRDVKAEHKGKINLKHSGTLPLVGFVRLLALRDGIKETSTLRRMAGLHEAGTLSDNEYDYLKGAFNHIAFLLLRQQLADFRAGLPVGNHVHPNDLTRREKDILTDSLRAIEHFRKRVHADFTGQIL